MEKIVVYTKPGCVRCYYTKKYMDVMGISYKEKDILASDAAWEEVKNMGFQSVPVIKGEQHAPFAGFQPDRIDQLASHNQYSQSY